MSTPNFNFTTFDPNDKPSWLGSWNGTMNAIDTALQDGVDAVDQANAAIETVSATATAAKTQADANKLELESQGAMIETLQDDVGSLTQIFYQASKPNYGMTAHSANIGVISNKKLPITNLTGFWGITLMTAIETSTGWENYGDNFILLNALKNSNPFGLPIGTWTLNVPTQLYAVAKIAVVDMNVPITTLDAFYNGTNTYLFTKSSVLSQGSIYPCIPINWSTINITPIKTLPTFS